MATLTSPARPPRLTPAQVQAFHEEGYLIHPEPVLPAHKFEALKAHFEQRLSEWPKDERPENMDVPHFTDPALNQWAMAPEVVDLVEPLLGPDIVLFSTHFICKPRGNGKRVPWHEDSAYWRRLLEPMEVVTVWLAIDPSTVANGCMYVIPRTHNTGRKGFSDYEDVDTAKSVFATEILPSQRRDELAVPCILQPNHASLHDARLMHGSPPNTSDIRRCGWTLRFIRASTRLNPEFTDRQLMYLARGRNLAGQPLADPAKAYPEVIALRKGFKAH
jgi:ectoine hydroxylase-related dioxygenase (phytanoyl-CoA dioxygenase family)